MACCEVLCHDRLELGEGATWTGSEWLWVDILGGAFYLLRPGEASPRKIKLPSDACGSVIPRRGGKMIAAVRHHLVSVDTSSGEVTDFAVPAPDAVPCYRDWRFNDGKAGPDGRIWVGTMGQPKPDGAVGALFRVDPVPSAVVDAGSVGEPGVSKPASAGTGVVPVMQPVLSGLTISNGIAWSPDGKTMYHTDTPTATITAYDYDTASGSISNGRIAVKVHEPEKNGWPDGCTTDADGNLWVAGWGGSRVTQFDPSTGAALRTLMFPATRVSSCAFGGPDLTDLLVTTAQEGMSEKERAEEPQAGMTFIVRGVGKGIAPAYAYDG